MAVRQHPDTPLVWCRDNLNERLTGLLVESPPSAPIGCASSGCRHIALMLNPSRAYGLYFAGPWPTSPSPTCLNSSGSSNAG